MTFESVNEATRLWIKGREFTISRLLGDTYKEEADRYIDGALAIFRLAPQDYHRFHSPVDGIIGHMTQISGEYYTVNVSYSLPFFPLAVSSLAHHFVLSRKQSALL
jgi:phosphatidylserine decarboxylase